jgi:hypothetical protein
LLSKIDWEIKIHSERSFLTKLITRRFAIAFRYKLLTLSDWTDMILDLFFSSAVIMLTKSSFAVSGSEFKKYAMAKLLFSTNSFSWNSELFPKSLCDLLLRFSAKKLLGLCTCVRFNQTGNIFIAEIIQSFELCLVIVNLRL